VNIEQSLTVKLSGKEEEIENLTALIETRYYPLRKSRLIRDQQDDGIFHRFLTLVSRGVNLDE
jgi:hypothetical protein